MTNNIFFHPFVGSRYFSGGIFGRRITVLGDSHYCGEDCAECGRDFNCGCNNFTIDTIRKYLGRRGAHDGWMSTYLKFERSLVNHETTPEESAGIWNSLLFYNYLQVAMQRSRQSGTVQQYAVAAEPFFAVMERYQPELLIVWGVRLWNNLPSEHWIDGELIQVDGYGLNNGYYSLSNGEKVRAVCVYHPSTGYDWSWWNKALARFL